MSVAAVDHAFFERSRALLSRWQPFPLDGRVRSVVGLLVEVEGIRPPIGAFCEIESGRNGETIEAEVVGFRGEITLTIPLGGLSGLRVGARVRFEAGTSRIPSGPGCLGRILDGFGRPIDGGPPLSNVSLRPLDAEPVEAVSRDRVDRPLDLGVRAVNSFSTIGQGMRMGIFAGSGVGKSTLLGQLATQADVDVCVIALIGERRREVREFIERDLGEALEHSVVVVSTSDEPAPLRSRAARVATAVAEGFRDEGSRVLLLMDSLTRFCTAQREIGLATGEPPTTRGYTPSVWSELPKLLERAGTTRGRGSITGLYTVLVEGDDMNEPIADSVRGILDGHVVLSRAIATSNIFPSVDVLESISRLGTEICSSGELALVGKARELLALYRENEDLINIGAYVRNSNPRIDRAIEKREPLIEFFRQSVRESSPREASFKRLEEILQ